MDSHTLAEVRGSGWTRGPRDLRGVADAMMEDGNPNSFYLLKFDDVTLVPEFIPFPYGRDATLDGGPLTPMRYVVRTDPVFFRLRSLKWHGD